MKKCFAIQFFFLSLIFLGCEKENDPLIDLDQLPYTLEQLDQLAVDRTKVAELVKELFNHKSNLAAVVISKGDVYQNLELMAATIIVRDLEPSDVVLEEQVEVEARGSNAYKWNGKSSRYFLTCFCYKYPCDTYVNFTGACKGASTKTTWRKCSEINCNIPSQCK